MFYDTAARACSSNLPSLYICQCVARNVLGRAPLTPCFVRRNRTPTPPHSFGNSQGAVGNGSRLYERLNTWMWRYGRGEPAGFK